LFINRYRFVELKYRRTEQNKKEGESGSTIKPARIETVVIFLPDVHSCMPNRSEWEGVQQQYKQALEKLLTADNDPVPDEQEQQEEVIVVKSDTVAVSSDISANSDTVAASSDISAKTDDNSATATTTTGTDDKEIDTNASDGKDLSIVNLASHKPHRLTKIISCLWFFSFVVWIIFSYINITYLTFHYCIKAIRIKKMEKIGSKTSKHLS
jgi:hypothetical protein